MYRAVSIISDIVIVVLLLLVIAFAGVRLIGLTPYAVLSGSMEPKFPVGSLIYVKSVDPATIRPGDAVTFYSERGSVMTHQAYEVDYEAEEILTQGINNRASDGSIIHDGSPVPFEQVIGAPIACIPLLGYLNVWSTTPPGIFIVIALAIVVIALPWLVGLLGGDKGQKDRSAVRAAGKHMR